jgi:LPXTG-site transpeptidase (sortase) family protein
MPIRKEPKPIQPAWRQRLVWHILSYLSAIIVLVVIGYALTQGVIIRIQQIVTTINSTPIVQLQPSPRAQAGTEQFTRPNPPTTEPTHLRIATIGLDARIIPVGWYFNPQTQQTEWEVARYAVGHHADSGVPGAGTNIVLSSHVAGYGRLFAQLDQLHIDDTIVVATASTQYTYRVTAIHYVPSTSANQQEHITNLALLDATPNEQLTLITCWPASGPERFQQRLIVVATPISGG